MTDRKKGKKVSNGIIQCRNEILFVSFSVLVFLFPSCREKYFGLFMKKMLSQKVANIDYDKFLY